MASDLSSVCTETIDILDEKEEGEISLEDVSSSEEGGVGHLTCGYVVRTRPCPGCTSTWDECASWCNVSSKMYPLKNQSRRDPVKGKENRHHVKEAGCATTKHTISTLQEKNDDLVPISSDSDMEIVGLMDISKQIVTQSKNKVRKKKKKKKNYESLTIDDLISPSSVDLPITECFNVLKKESRETAVTKGTNLIKTNRTHYRELSPVRRSNRIRVTSRSPLRRYRSPIRARSPYRPSQSSLNRSRSPLLRRSPRRSRSPKRSSPYISPLRITSRRLPKPESSSHSYVDKYGDVTKLLKRVKHLDSVGAQAIESNINRSKEHQSSLKEKLSNMMKKIPDSNGNVTLVKEKSNTYTKAIKDADDEEDLALLRQKALETKQKKSKKTDYQIKPESEKHTVTKNDDQDEEDLELRMIALRSAVMKKHQNRVQRGIKPAVNKKIMNSGNESPFNQSFLDNIPIPGEELLKLTSPPYTSPLLLESNHIEDMDLDTDVEREKEKLPYSPTDKITMNIPIDTELLGIEPSDVSFINLNDKKNSSTNNMMSPEDDKKSLETGIIANRTYLPNMYYGKQDKYEIDKLHSLRKKEMLQMDLSNEQTPLPTYLGDSHDIICELIDGICCQEETYVPADVSIYKKSNVSQTLPVTQELSAPSIPSNDVPAFLHNVVISNLASEEQLSNIQENNYRTQAVSEHLVIDSSIMSALGSVSSNASVIAIDNLPEMNESAGPFVEIERNLQITDYNIPNDEASCMVGETMQEPLYMQGVPDVTKDVNKIPTLINRTLVPAPILKSNKQLQQPLPSKKHETHPEPTFKNAEMQPVIVTTDVNVKNNTVFKPMKLTPSTKKTQSVLTTPIAFDFFNDVENDVSMSIENSSTNSNENQEIGEPTRYPIIDLMTASHEIVPIPIRKKRKRRKTKRKVFFAALQSTKETNVNNDVTGNSIIVPQIVELDQDNDNRIQENIELSNIENVQETIDCNDIENRDIEQIDQHMSTTNDGIELKNTMLSTASECPQKNNTESHSLLINSDIATSNKVTEMAKDIDNRRLSTQSVDEDEDELRAILLASLGKRTTKSDINIMSVTPSAIKCTTTDNPIQISAQKTVNNTTITTNMTCTSANNKRMLSTVNPSEADNYMSNITMKRTNNTPILPFNVNKKTLITTTIAKNPPNKMMRKMPISTRTKLVNNIKTYSAKKYIDIRNKTKLNETVWSSNTKTSHTSKTQRIVINLGSDTDSESESEKRQTSTSLSSSSVAITENLQTQNSNSDFEKSLHKFLRDVRKEHESTTVFKSTTLAPQTTKKDTTQIDSNKSSSDLFTPSAVKHLSASQQKEYHRLKQQILEREKLKLQRKVASNNSSNSNNKLLETKATGSPYNKNSIHDKQNQIKLKESDNTSPQLLTEIVAKATDAATNIMVETSNTYTSANKDVVANTAKPINSVHLKTKGNLPNFSIKITNEMAPIHTRTESGTIENPIDSVNENESIKENQLKPVLRALSKDEINRKYVQIQQDMIGQIIPENNKLSHNSANINPHDKNLKNSNIENNFEAQNSENNCNNNRLPDASTLSVNSNANKNEFTDTVDTTALQYNAEHQQEVNHNIQMSINSNTENNSHNINNTHQSDTNVINKANIATDVYNTFKDGKGVDPNINLSELEQQHYLRDTEHKLVTKRYTVLNYLAEMSGNLRQWDMEKDLQSSLVVEVNKLKEQLKIAEERLQVQCNRVSSMGPKVSAACHKINIGRRECSKLSKMCSSLGKRLTGKDYQVPVAVSQLLDDKLKEVANHIRQLSRKKCSSNNISTNPIVSNSIQQTSLPTESFKVTCDEESLSLQEQPENDVLIDVVESNELSHFEELNDNENLSISNPSQLPLSQIAPSKNSDTSINVSKTCNNEQNIFNQNNALSLELKQASTSILIRENKEHGEQTQNVSECTAQPSESTSSATDSLLCHQNEHQKKSTTIQPYVSILTHFKTPRSKNPNGILCPYELMGICNDGDCQFVHQSTSHI